MCFSAVLVFRDCSPCGYGPEQDLRSLSFGFRKSAWAPSLDLHDHHLVLLILESLHDRITLPYFCR